MQELEIPLSGGNVNAAVVRSGNTVRREQTPHSATIHQLLLHLERKGFEGSPRFLGIDEGGREILSFIEGGTGIPPAIWQSDGPPAATAMLLRRYHEAALDFQPPSGASWAFTYPDPQRHEVICHNDFAPYNFVYAPSDGATPLAVLDFDLAGPGPRLRDVAYAAYWLAPLSFSGGEQKEYALRDLSEGSRRLKLFCTVYGIAPDDKLLVMVAEVLDDMGDEQRTRRVVGEAAAAKLVAEGHLAYWQREAAAFRGHLPQVKENL
jgi:hypothetical protein